MFDSSSTEYRDFSWDRLPDTVQAAGAARLVIVTDSNLFSLYDWKDAGCIQIPAGEASKCLAQAELLYAELARQRVDRSTWVVAFGGGVVGDLVGFVAATYLRGLPLVQVPTTLVAQVDSSLGGKVGVDLPAGKNLVGAFHPAQLILLDPDLLATLPESQWSSGMAEVLKHALLDGADHWEYLEQLPEKLSSAERGQLVRRSRQVKLAIVAEDPFERGIRAHLNLGHTLAHAIESAQNYTGWNHGEAVGFGLRAALRLSRRRLGLAPRWEERLLAQLQRYRLPARRPDLAFAELVPFLLRDKKNQGGQLRMVLLSAPGQARLESGIELEELEAVWEELA